MNILHLTPAEQSLFEALPSALREGWVIETENRGYVDTPQRMEIRMALLRLHDPKLLALREKTATAQSADEVAAIIADTDLHGVDNDDLASLFFALGPTITSSLIAYMIPQAESDKDVEAVTALALIRHAMLNAFQSASTRSR